MQNNTPINVLLVTALISLQHFVKRLASTGFFFYSTAFKHLSVLGPTLVHVLPHFLKLFLKTLCRSFLFLVAQDTLEVDCHPVACNKVFGLVRNLSALQASLEPVLEVSLKSLEALPQSELRLNIQHDAHVFAMKLIGDLNTRHNNDFCEVVYRRFSKCFNCDEAESSDDIKENMIIIDILQDGEEDITSVQNGLDVRYADDYRNRMECKCGRNDKGYQYVVMNTPPELAVVIKRYTHDNSVARKLRVPVFPSYLIDLENHSVNNEQKAGSSQQRGDSLETQYILRSVITHHGSSLDAGHYTCCVFLNEHTVLTMNDNAVTVSESEWNEELLYNSYMLFYERVDTVDMMFDSCAPALMFCLFADRTKLSTRWKRSFPLRKFNQVRDEFLDQKITKTLFHQLLLIAAREVYQRLPCDVYDKDFDVLTCLLLQQCVRNISLRLIGVEIVDCRECGSCNVDLINNNSIHVNQVSKKSIQKLFEKPKRPCNYCQNVETVQTVVFDVPDVLVLKCDSVKCNDVRVSSGSLFNLPIEVVVNRSTMSKVIKYRASCVYLERRNKLLMPIKETMIWWDYKGTMLLDETEHAEYLRREKHLFTEGETSHVILVKEMEESPVTMLATSQKLSSRTIEHSLSATFTSRNPSATCESTTEIVNETSNESEFVKKHSLDSTLNGGMLSSDIINAYMALIANESILVHKRNILVISVDKLMSLEKRINSNNFKGVKNNAKSLVEKAFSQAITAYCIDEIHWIAMVFDFTSGLITYIDPLGNSPCLRAVKLLTNYVNVYTAIVHRGEGISESKLYVMSSEPNFTRQRDSVSCGVYICMYLRFKVLSRNLLPTNINIHLERRHTYLAITGKSICVTSNVVEKIMVAHLHAIPRDAGRSYKFQDTGKQSVITLTERELNDLNSDGYQELYDRAVRKYPDLTSGYVYELVKKARNTIETEMSNILKACNDSNSQTLKPFVEVLDPLKARDYRRLKKYETSRNDSHSKYFAGKESLMESVLDIELRTILFKSFENEGRNGHMKISVIGECCSSSDPICRSSVHFMEHVLIPICMIGYAAESKKLSRDEAIAKMYSVQV